ncbi:MAG: sulfatase [Myxococcales bacterium]|nr:sulfatase [Myxococcales bacterium]
MRRGWIGAGVAAVGVAGAAWWAASQRPAPVGPTTPNVLIVMWDTARADRMSLYGHDRPTTPRLEALASSSVVYERAMSPGMWTVPAHGSLFTGLPASSHGARVGWLWLDGHHRTLAEHFGEGGYATFAWSSNPYLSEQTNLLQGFTTTHYSWRGEAAVAAGNATRGKLIAEDRSVEIAPAWVPSGHGKGWAGHLTAVKDGGPVIVDTFLDWVDGLQGEPFLGYLNFLEAHHPRVPSMASRLAVADEDAVQRGLQRNLSLFRLMAAMEGRDGLNDADHEALALAYDASLRDLDTATGRLVDGLAARGLLDDTVLVVVSDHGEHLGEGGLYEHRWSVDQELLHVPLLVRYPAALTPRRVSEPVSTRHLFGSLLALAELTPPDGAALPTLGEGEVVSELVASTPRLPEVREHLGPLDPDRWRRRYKVWIDADFKYVRDSTGGQRLADLAEARPDDVDVGPQQPEAMRSHAQSLRLWERQRPKYQPQRRAPTDAPGRPLAADDGTAEQLRQLGYTEGEP